MRFEQRSVRNGLFITALSTACILQACASSSGAGDSPSTLPEASVPADSGAPEAGADAGTVDNGAPSNVFPAPHPAPRQLVKLPGPVLAHPTVIPVFFGDDPERPRTEMVLQSLVGSDYWKNLGEYGVGDIAIGPSVVLADTAPAKFSLEGIDTTVSSLWTRAVNPAPAPDGTQIYALFFPQQTELDQVDGSRFCSSGGAYHDSHGTDYAYAITPHCGPSFDDYMISATHELIEAATDPYPLVSPAWAGADPAHVGFRGEVGDLCDYGGKLNGGGIALLGTRVERIFSNARAKTGHDPCVPDLGLAYFGAAPEAKDDIKVQDVVLGAVPGKGVNVKVGQTVTVTVDLYSDQKLTPWEVSVDTMDLSTHQASTKIEATLDRTKGENGEKLHLTISRKAKSSGGDLVFLRSVSKQSFFSDSIYVGN